VACPRKRIFGHNDDDSHSKFSSSNFKSNSSVFPLNLQLHDGCPTEANSSLIYNVSSSPLYSDEGGQSDDGCVRSLVSFYDAGVEAPVVLTDKRVQAPSGLYWVTVEVRWFQLCTSSLVATPSLSLLLHLLLLDCCISIVIVVFTLL